MKMDRTELGQSGKDDLKYQFLCGFILEPWKQVTDKDHFWPFVTAMGSSMFAIKAVIIRDDGCSDEPLYYVKFYRHSGEIYTRKMFNKEGLIEWSKTLQSVRMVLINTERPVKNVIRENEDLETKGDIYGKHK